MPLLYSNIAKHLFPFHPIRARAVLMLAQDLYEYFLYLFQNLLKALIFHYTQLFLFLHYHHNYNKDLNYLKHLHIFLLHYRVGFHKKSHRKLHIFTKVYEILIFVYIAFIFLQCIVKSPHHLIINIAL